MKISQLLFFFSVAFCIHVNGEEKPKSLDPNFKLQLFADNSMVSTPVGCTLDGSGRLQSVKKELRPRYYSLIKAFYEITGIPILINTSFNENEPVVNIPEEAIDCYLRTDMDMLVLGNYILEK